MNAVTEHAQLEHKQQWRQSYSAQSSNVNKDLTCKAKAKVKDQTGKDKAMAKELSVKAKAKDLVPKAKDLPIW